MSASRPGSSSGASVSDGGQADSDRDRDRDDDGGGSGGRFAVASLEALAARVLKKLRQGSMRGHRRACATMIELRDALLDRAPPAPADVTLALVCAGTQVYRQKHAAADEATVGDLAMTQALLFGLLVLCHRSSAKLRPGGADADADADGEVGTANETVATWENTPLRDYMFFAQARNVGVGAGGRGGGGNRRRGDRRRGRRRRRR